MKKAMRFITIILAFLLTVSCREQTRDFGKFSLKIPSSWQYISQKGIDSYIGLIAIDSKDTLFFDYGHYSSNLAIIKTIKVEIVKFKDISPEYAFIEGEGDKSLGYWQEVHWAYYTRELSELNLKPTIDMELVCEYFETIWPKI